MPMTMQEAGRLGYIASKNTQIAKKEERIRNYQLNPLLCSLCKSPVDYKKAVAKRSQLKSGKTKNIFCSHNCSAKFSNSKRIVHKLCMICQKPTGRPRHKFCSHSCQQKSQWKKKKELIENQPAQGIRYKSSLKRLVKERDGDKCAICHITEWMGKLVLLILDHIDGNPYNNLPENLRLVCSNCDAQLPTYKGKNAGKGRFSRRQRYRQGLSY